jgi:diketogulonate reductase-like aldo/keto reductase
MTSIPPRSGIDGAQLPAIGLGTLELQGRSGVAAIGTAIDLGYRLLDSAFIYDNEGTVGRAVRDSAVPRDELIVSTKLRGRAHEYDAALRHVEESLFRTGLDHLDLVLIHWPNPRVDLYVEAWRALIEARERGLTRMIGVSNFLPEHLDRLIDETGVTPVVNQIEVQPYFPQHDLIDANAERGILTEGWSPLGRGTDLLENPVIVRLAASHGVSPARLVLAWSVDCGVIPLPKAPRVDWQAENLDVFDIELTDDDRSEIATLARPDGRVSGQDPRTHEEF